MIGDVAALAAGGVIGAAFFGGLWWTVRRLPRTRSPAFLVLGGFAARMVFLAAALYGILTTGVAHLLLALIGILAARELLSRRFRGDSGGPVSRPDASPMAGGDRWS